MKNMIHKLKIWMILKLTGKDTYLINVKSIGSTKIDRKKTKGIIYSFGCSASEDC